MRKVFPNLTDGDWLYGGTPETIETTILNGRNGIMPPMIDAVGGPQGVKEVANYVRQISGQKPYDEDLAALGKEKFAVCAACHGPEGKGNPALGAPNLTDNVWLYGGSLTAIMETITKGRNNVMPAFKDLLGEEKVHLLAAYVYSFPATTIGGNVRAGRRRVSLTSTSRASIRVPGIGSESPLQVPFPLLTIRSTCVEERH